MHVLFVLFCFLLNFFPDFVYFSQFFVSKGCVNPATIFKPEFYILFTILNMNMYPIITNMNNSLQANFSCIIWWINPILHA